MAQALVIVESPAKAKTIGKILGKDYVVKASAGHVRDLPKKKLGVDVKKNFNLDYEVLPEREDIVKDLQAAGLKAKEIFLAPDPDREGEAIAWHLAAVLVEGGSKAKIRRIQFNEITKDAILNSLKKPREIDIERVNAQQARRVLDRLVGYKISPLLWQKVRRGLSAGRVQSVAARLVCDREKAILAFKPEEYWTVSTQLQKGKKPFKSDLSKWKGKKPDLKTEAQTGLVVGALEVATFVVSSVGTANQKRNPSPPFITSSLQQEASKRHGFTVKRTMALAQELYEGLELPEEGAVGLITYMRTDSVRVAKEAQEEAIEYIVGKYGKDYLPSKPRIYKTKSSAQDAHEAIRPTSAMRSPELMKPYLKPDLFKLYKLIWERFLASQMESATLTVLTVDITAGDATLRSTATKVKFAGFHALYKDTTEEGEDGDADAPSTLPDLAEGDTLERLKIEPKQHFTQPPPRFTEATLVKLMEEKQIGRPSTYAPTISTIQDRGYVIKEGRALMPTELGNQVNDQLVAHFPNIVDPSFTAEMEENLDKVEHEGQIWQDLIKAFYVPFAETLKIAKEEMKPVAVESGQTCELCGKPLLIKYGRFGEFLSCAGYPECKNAKPIIKRIGLVCRNEGCGGDIVEKKSRKGMTFFGCTGYPTCTFTSWDQPTETKCPDCETFMNIKISKRKGSFLLCPNEACKKISKLPSKKKQEEAEEEAEAAAAAAV
ncbi:MAG: type I DNA topoisomerase [Candidatus Sericytochromatia bacterium]|nr:type I DNA topoisomerase [Candidatus Sericytochromatia bacterium]